MNNNAIKFLALEVLGILILAAGMTAPLFAQDADYSKAPAEQAVTKDHIGGSKVIKAGSDAKGPEAAPAPSSTYNWSGFYIGGHVGYGSGKGDTSFSPLPDATTFVNLRPATLDVKPRGVMAGAQAGYNWQFGNFVFGAEADISGARMRKTVTQSPIVQNNGTPFPGAGFIGASQEIKMFGTVRPRTGVAFGRALVYGTAGLAYANVEYAANTDFRPFGTTRYPVNFNKTKTGWTAGAGVEIAVNKHWSVKGEYLYYDLGSATSTVSATPTLPPYQVKYDWETKGSVVRAGVNFRF